MIREYRQADTQELIDIWYNASIIAHNFIPSEFWASEKINIQKKYLPNAETYVKEVEGKIVGFISLIDNFIGGLFVSPGYQGKGIGTELINKARSLKKDLTVEVYKDNIQAHKFYRKCGFIAINESIQLETGCISISMKLID